MQLENPAVIVMAKTPRPGYVKTRLRPVLSDEQCADLARGFLQDTVRKTKEISATTIIAYTPDDGGDEMRSLLPYNARLIAQRGSDLGERLESAIADADADGFGPFVVIGTDSPTLPASFIGSAFEHLRDNANSLVIGPTDDGGYYLIGMSHPETRLFRKISWSTGRVFEQTVARAKEIPDVRILELPSWYDVDEPADITRLIAEFEKDEGARLTAPETFQWLTATGLVGLFEPEVPNVTRTRVNAVG